MRITIFVLLLTVFVVSLSAKDEDISGEWLMYSAVQPGRSVEPYLILDFNATGTIALFGMDFGTWKHHPDDGILTLQSKMEPDFNGDAAIIRFDNDTLIIKLDTVQFSFAKLNDEEIKRKNRLSGLLGIWQLDGYQNFYMKFAEPDSFLSVDNNDGSLSTFRGKWLYNPTDSTLIVISFLRDLRGKSSLKQITDNRFTIVNSGNEFYGKRVDTGRFNIERLTFTEEGFEEDTDYSDKLPWQDFDLMRQRLAGIKRLVYRSGYLIADMNVLFYGTDLKFVRVDESKGRVNFVNKVIHGRDTMQVSEDYKDDLRNSFNPFFPEHDAGLYRVAGKDTIEVPAGEFNCTVVEAIDGFKKIKYWMINDLPGVYAKIIYEEDDGGGDVKYYQKELMQIVR